MLGGIVSARTIAAYGSGEFQPWAEDVDRVVLAKATTGDGSVVIFPTASAPEGAEVFDKWARMGLDHYENMGVAARVSGLKARADAFSEDHLAQLENASMYYFSGGNPAYLADTLRDSPLWSAIVDGINSGVAISGCSAGACIMGDVAPDSTADRDFASGVWPSHWYSSGLSILPEVMFGPHWDAMDGWIPGITNFIRKEVPDNITLLAIDENTAIIGDIDNFTVYGVGKVEVAPGGTPEATYGAGDTFSLQ